MFKTEFNFYLNRKSTGLCKANQEINDKYKACAEHIVYKIYLNDM